MGRPATDSLPDAQAALQSEYTGGDDGRAYPVTIHGEIRAESTSAEGVEPRLASTLGQTLPVLALSGNAAVADPLAVAFYGLDLAEPQPFIGYGTPRAHEWFPPGARRFDQDSTAALMRAVGQHPQYPLLIRAIEAYRRALGHWVPEEHLLAGEYLFIAAETLSRCLIESRAGAKGITPKNLAQLEGVSTDALRRRYLEQDVFGGDAAALEAVNQASDGFEHGYMDFDQVRGLIGGVLGRSMGHVRRALIRASGLDAAAQDRLFVEEFEEPRGLVPAIRFIRGQIRRKDSDRPPPELEVGAIELEFTFDPPVVVSAEDEKVTLKFPTNYTVIKMPDDVELTLHEAGMRAAHISVAGPTEVKVTRAANDSEDPGGLNGGSDLAGRSDR